MYVTKKRADSFAEFLTIGLTMSLV